MPLCIDMSDVLNRCVYEDRYFQVVAPDFPLNCREDGGHLVVVKKEPVTDRSDVTYREAVASMLLQIRSGGTHKDLRSLVTNSISHAPGCTFPCWRTGHIRIHA